MTAPSPRPKRRRWRWMVVAALACFAYGLGLVWWNQPTLDDRFVGKWSGGGMGFPANGLTFQRDGSCQFEDGRAMMWAVNQNVLYLFDEAGSWQASYRRGWLTSHFSFAGGRFKILSVQDKTISLAQIGQLLRTDQFTLQRVSRE